MEIDFSFALEVAILASMVLIAYIPIIGRNFGAKRRIFLASILAPIMYQIYSYISLGYLDPFFIVAFIVQLAVSFAMAIVIHWANILLFRGRL